MQTLSKTHYLLTNELHCNGITTTKVMTTRLTHAINKKLKERLKRAPRGKTTQTRDYKTN